MPPAPSTPSGWGTAASTWLEGLPAVAPPAGASLERLPGGSAGSTVDTNSNLADFTVRSVPDPQNARIATGARSDPAQPDADRCSHGNTGTDPDAGTNSDGRPNPDGANGDGDARTGGDRHRGRSSHGRRHHRHRRGQMR